MRRHIPRLALCVCLVSVLTAAWTPPVFWQVAPVNYRAYWDFENAANPANANNALFHGSSAAAGSTPARDTAVVPPPFAGIESTASMRFDGGDAILVGTPPLDLLKNDGAFTLSGWIRPANVSGSKDIIRVATNDAANTRGVLMLVDSGGPGKLRGGARAGDAEGQLNRTSTDAITVNQWTHVAAVLNIGGDSVVLYVNGAVAGSAGATAFTAATTGNTDSAGATLGANIAGTGNRWNGHLDDLRVYERALSAAEVRSLAAPRAPSQTPATPGPEQVTVNWTGNQPGAAVGYNVYRRNAGSTGPWTLMNATPVMGNSYTDTTTLQVTVFEYMVRSVQTEHPRLESIDSNTMLAAGDPPLPRTNDGSEGMFEDKCACGSSAGGPALPGALAGLAALAIVLRRRRTL